MDRMSRAVWIVPTLRFYSDPIKWSAQTLDKALHITGSTPELSSFALRCVFLDFPDRDSSQEEQRFKEICLSRDKEDSKTEEKHVVCVTSYEIVLKPSRKLFLIKTC